jgi:hypothetical protein
MADLYLKDGLVLKDGNSLRGCCCPVVDPCKENFHCGNKSWVEVTSVKYQSCCCFHNHCNLSSSVVFREGFGRAATCNPTTTICGNVLSTGAMSISWGVPNQCRSAVSLDEITQGLVATSDTCSSGTTELQASVLSHAKLYSTGTGYIQYDFPSSCACNDGQGNAKAEIKISFGAGNGRRMLICTGAHNYDVGSGQSGTDTMTFFTGRSLSIYFHVL